MTSSPHSSGRMSSRRSITHGLAWAAPAVSLSAVSPASATSAKPTLTSSTRFQWATSTGTTGFPYTCAGRGQYQITQTPGGGITPYVRVDGIRAGTVLSGLTSSFWLAVDRGTTFTRVTGSSTCWSVPKASGLSTTRNGIVFYEYVSTYTCPITVTGTSWVQPSTSNFNFVSSCQSTSTKRTGTYHYTQSVTVNGTTVLTKDNGWNNVIA